MIRSRKAVGVNNVLRHPDKSSWLRSRSTFIGASESAAILGFGYSGQSVATVFADKLVPEVEKDVADRVVIGSLIEPGLVAVFNYFTGFSAELEEPYLVRLHPEHRYIAATLDAAIVDDGERIPVELKNIDVQFGGQWKDGATPEKYIIQCQHQLLVTGAERMYLMAMIGGNRPQVRELVPDPEFHRTLIEILGEFWECVQRREFPEKWVDWSQEATAKALRRLHPEDNGLTTYLPPEADQLIAEWESAKAQRKAWEDHEAGLKNQLKAMIGDNTYGLTPEGSYLECPTISMAEQIRKPTEFRRLTVSRPKQRGRR